MHNYLGSIDILVLVSYFAIVLTMGLYFARRSQTTTEYFLAGRQVGWLAVAFSLFATNISSEHFIGLAGSGASSGLAVGHFEWMACLIVLLLAWFFAPVYLKAGVFTMPEFLERRFNRGSRLYLTTVSIIAYILTKISVTLLAGGLLLHQILGWNMITSALVMVVVTGIYTIVGGMSAVIYTGVIQTIVLIGGATLLTVLGLQEVGGMSGLRAALPADFFHMFKPASDPVFPWTGIVFGAPILAIWYWCTDQVIVQRTLCARGIAHARTGAIITGYLKILPVFILILPGLIALALFPGIRGDEAYPALVTSHLLPSGVRGVVIASLLAAMMSSLAATFNSSSTLLTMDFYRRFRPQATDRELVLIGQLATIVLVIFGILWVPLIRTISNQIFIYLQSVQAYISPPIAAVFLMGIITRRINGTGAIWALVVGGLLGALRLGLEILTKMGVVKVGWWHWFINVNYLHFAIFLFLFAIVLMAGISWLTRKSDNTPKYPEINNPEKTPSDLTWKINLGLSVLLILIVISLWGIFF